MRRNLLGCLTFMTTLTCLACQASEQPLELVLFKNEQHKINTVKTFYEFRELNSQEPILKSLKLVLDIGLPLGTIGSLYKGLNGPQKSFRFTLLGLAFGAATATYFANWRKQISTWEKENKKQTETLLDCAKKLKKDVELSSEQYFTHKAFFKLLSSEFGKEPPPVITKFQKTVNEKLKPAYETLKNIYPEKKIETDIKKQFNKCTNEISRIRNPEQKKNNRISTLLFQ